MDYTRSAVVFGRGNVRVAESNGQAERSSRATLLRPRTGAPRLCRCYPAGFSARPFHPARTVSWRASWRGLWQVGGGCVVSQKPKMTEFGLWETKSAGNLRFTIYEPAHGEERFDTNSGQDGQGQNRMVGSMTMDYWMDGLMDRWGNGRRLNEELMRIGQDLQDLQDGKSGRRKARKRKRDTLQPILAGGVACVLAESGPAGDEGLAGLIF